MSNQNESSGEALTLSRIAFEKADWKQNNDFMKQFDPYCLSKLNLMLHKWYARLYKS